MSLKITTFGSMDIDSSKGDILWSGFYTAALTTAQIAALRVSNADPSLDGPLRNGALIYNTTTDVYRVYQAGAWATLAVSLDPSGNLVALSAAANPAAPLNGMIYYNTAAGVTSTRMYNTPLSGAGWSNVYQMVSAATGIGLTVAGAGPFTLPTGGSVATEAGGNQVNGFLYYNATATNLRAYTHAVWATLFTTTTAATGAGLAAGNTPLVLPNGVDAQVEVPGNQVNGFMYAGTTSNSVRVYNNGGWHTVTIV